MNPRWPFWKVILAYTAMTALALASVWFVDRKVHLLPRTAQQAANPIAPASK